ncbi:UNVERIFIED_CONTAM: hypothetical protein GTU68_007210 [Idotea baltica]|nr:hypothetical protein [Idotea baltica]
MGRVYISAAHKSSGKTTLSIGLCAAFAQQGKKVQPFKKGPDYIDPLWLSNASSIHQQRQCYNLDFNTQSTDEIIHTLNYYGTDADINIIEGNKGLHDGVALDGSDSNAAMAKLTQSPVILVIDSRGVTRGVAPLLLGYQHFDKDIKIAGVIYNFCGGARHEQKLRAVTEQYTDIPVLGMLRKSASMDLAERHLGLMPSNETKDAKQRISEIAQFVTGSVDLSKVFDCASTAIELPQKLHTINVNTQYAKKVRIGICEDASFGFYYPDDKQALIDAGAELVSINTLSDDYLPADIDGLFIGGGFPETQMDALEANESMRESIHTAIESGLPTYAECGGLMYLSESIHWKKQSADMVGIIPAKSIMNQKPQGRGYVRLEETESMPWDSIQKSKQSSGLDENTTITINAHEFHYSSLKTSSGTSSESLYEKGSFAYKVKRGVGITGQHDGWVYKNLLANYSHIRSTEASPWANRFVEFIHSKVDTKVIKAHELDVISEV